MPSLVPRVDATRHSKALAEKEKSKWLLDDYNLLVGNHSGLAEHSRDFFRGVRVGIWNEAVYFQCYSLSSLSILFQLKK